jgi:hypothetical protein
MSTLTITTTAQQDQRIIAAFGRYLGLTDAQGAPRNATAAEVKAAMIAHIRTTVHTYETQRAIELAALQPLDPT